ncbi:hypothetical protein EGH24_13850 [Halonotius terrestris]|uniref:Uncharacterized protein n=1 Tax=Halonotius terrestris TaxID=2487750 RepID=A0A8J8P7J0_9EURY|nr:hypothetical protein [Halonotius terrestris]TQQ78601.1 hypothetical protein EGH24_13850 [Halonotius terrestris]
MARSAAYVITIVAALMFIVGVLVLTVTDPVLQTLFDSALWSSSTQQGSDLLRWQKAVWGFIGTAILIAITLEVWIVTRQPQ